MHNSDEERKAFEDHTRKLCLLGNYDAEHALRRKPNGNYAESKIYAAWRGWQACGNYERSKAKAVAGVTPAEISESEAVDIMLDGAEPTRVFELGIGEIFEDGLQALSQHVRFVKREPE